MDILDIHIDNVDICLLRIIFFLFIPTDVSVPIWPNDELKQPSIYYIEKEWMKLVAGRVHVTSYLVLFFYFEIKHL